MIDPHFLASRVVTSLANDVIDGIP